MGVIINPGSGPVAGATLDEARANVDAFLVDVGAEEWVTIGGGDDLGDGRYRFTLHGERDVELDMPGLPVERVRFTGAAGEDIWQYPRLYVNGSSWVWCFAVDIAHEALSERLGPLETTP